MVKRCFLLFLRMLFVLVAFLIAVELVGGGLCELGGNRRFCRAKIQAQLAGSGDTESVLGINATKNDFLGWMGTHVLHPYLGFVEGGAGANKYGFVGEEPVQKKSKDKVIVGIFGGSAATMLYNLSRSTLVEELKRSSTFNNKQITIIGVTLGGYKQPQQLIALNFLLTLGAEFDYVVNLDGFNEAALPYSDNYTWGTYLFFPRHWSFYVQKTIDKQSLQYMVKMSSLFEYRNKLRNLFAHNFLNQSLLALIIWQRLDDDVNIRLTQLQGKVMLSSTNSDLPPEAVGPLINYSSTQQLFNDEAQVWFNSSLQMYKISKENNIQYLHFLQSNQYYLNSKVFTAEEKQTAFINYVKDDSNLLHAYKYKEAVEKTYPLFIVLGKKLTEEGVNFYDLTYLFKNTLDTIYIDVCCHYNQDGNDMLAKEIAKQIINLSANTSLED